MTKTYGIEIKAGNGSYGVKSGWDTEFTTREDAKDCARRAGRREGWIARVVTYPAKVRA